MSALALIENELSNLIININRLIKDEFLGIHYEVNHFEYNGFINATGKPWLCERDLVYLEQTFCENFKLGEYYLFEREDNKLVVSIYEEDNPEEYKILYDGRKYSV